MSTHALGLAMYRRNAIYKAWSSHGNPFLASWSIDARLEFMRLRMDCTVCRHESVSRRPYRQGVLLDWGWARWEIALADIEESVLKYMAGRTVPQAFQQNTCSHVVEILDTAPPEVAALIELEFLAG